MRYPICRMRAMAWSAKRSCGNPDPSGYNFLKDHKFYREVLVKKLNRMLNLKV